MSITSTQSGYYTASEICESGDLFGTWANEVSLLLPPRLSLLPALQELEAESRRFPQWLFDQNSNEYKQFQIVSTQDPTSLPLWLAGAGNLITAVADEQLSQSALRALDRILYLWQVHTFLVRESQSFGSAANESELRQALEGLACHVWFSETGPKQGYLSRSECALKLPKTNEIKIADSTVDSVTFFFQPKSGYSIDPLPGAMISTLVSTVQKSPRLSLVHWVTEYKTLATEDVKRQRRALGRLDDFVFGTAHSESTLIIYAARWEQTVQKCSSDAGQPPDISDKGKTVFDPELQGTVSPMNPPATSKKRPGSGKSVPSSENTEARKKLAGPSREVFPNKRFKSGSEATPSLIADGGGTSGYKIVVYQIQEYKTTNLTNLLQFYFLMRASRRLADKYRTEIFADPWEAVLGRLARSPVFAWPSRPRTRTKDPPALPTVHENPAGGGGHQAQLTDCDSDAGSAAFEPEDAAEWNEEWRHERQIAIEECGPSSLKGFKSAKPGIGEFGLDDRVSLYLESLYN